MSINQWSKKGNLFLWSYSPKKKNYPGWHMNADKEGYSSLIDYLNALFECSSDSWRTISLDRKGKDQLLGHPRDQRPSHKLVIKQHENPSGWSFEVDEEKTYFSVGKNNLKMLVDGINNAKTGSWDFSIGTKNGESLWFW